MIRDSATAERAAAMLKMMGKVIAGGDADDALVERYRVGTEMLVAYEITETRVISDHLSAEVASAHWRGRKAGTGPVPLDPGQPVPGCGCPDCTGLPADHPARHPRRKPRRDLLPTLNVDAARAVPILDVAAMLGIEHKRGWAVCPFHADTDPSLHLNAEKQTAFCNVCGKSWDGIALIMEFEKLEFTDAVRRLAA